MTTFDPTRPGKHFFDLAEITAGDPAIQPDIVCSINNGEGPSVVLCGGIHGDEYEPQVILRQMAAELDVADVKGRLVIIPTINPPASQGGGRISAADGKNMNRVFPGNNSGTVTERLAAFLHDTMFGSFDLLVDVHSGGGDYRVVPMIFGFTSDACKLSTAALETVMEAWDYPFIEYVSGIASTSAGSAPLAGTTSVEIEGGSGGALEAGELAIMRDGILRGLKAFGVLAGEPGPMQREVVRVDVGKANQHPAPRAGLIEHKVALGARVAPGDLLAVLHPAAGADPAVHEVRATVDGHVLRQRARAFVAEGELIVNTGTLR